MKTTNSLHISSTTFFKAKKEEKKPHFLLGELGYAIVVECVCVRVSAILCGSALGQQKYPG